MSLRGRRHGGSRKNELVFLTTCGPATTFDPKITGVAGTWYFDDGTTLAAASGAEISKTFAVEGLHRAVFRPGAGGLAAITAIDCSTDLVVKIQNIHMPSSLSSMYCYGNASLCIDISFLSRAVVFLSATSCTSMTGRLADISRVATDLLLGDCPLITGDLSDLPSTIQQVRLFGNSLITGDLSDLPANITYFSAYGSASILTGSVSQITKIRTLLIYNMGWDSDDVDTVIDSIYQAVVADPNHFTYAGPIVLQIGGSGGTANAAPSGVYQEATPPTTGLEKVYYLTHLAAHTWAITWNGGSGP